MIVGSIVLGAPEWLWWAVAIAVVAVPVLIWSYTRSRARPWVRATCGLLKAAGIGLLAVCLLEPLYSGTRAAPGSNLFLVVADNSRSSQLSDGDGRESRAAWMSRELSAQSTWLSRLGQDFDVRSYSFDAALHPLKDFSQLRFDGEASSLQLALQSLAERFRGDPVAGVLLLTDGNATDLADAGAAWSGIPPVYPVALASAVEKPDVSVVQVSVSQTNFEAAPVTIAAEVAAHAVGDRKVVLRVFDQDGKEVERRLLALAENGERIAQRFLVRPENPGISFYTVHASLEGEEELDDPRENRAPSTNSIEATLANNRRIATVDRGGGPYRVLYVSGRPNWEYKFMRRALDEDDEVQLVALVRVAKQEPKFSFLSRTGERTNPIYRGFGNNDDEQAEQYDEPVLLRLGTADKEELRGGFPKDAEAIFAYHAIILDDIEASFFTQDQQSLLQQFVSQRGGGLLMLGGKDSFATGNYQRTPVGEMLPVYLDRATPLTAPQGYQLRLTREGWLQPWIRLRDNESDEQQRLAQMPAFHTLNRIDAIKPGASVLAEVETADGVHPALAVQPFGRGRVGALLVGDLWRWNLRRPKHEESDLDKSWRQTVRWLVADIPQRVEVDVRKSPNSSAGSVEIVVRARDKSFSPLDNANVTLQVSTPDNRQIELLADSSDTAAGQYHTTFAPKSAGAYHAQIVVTAPDGSTVGQREVGWAVEPETEEFRELAGNQALLDRIAADTGGEVLERDELDKFVAGLPNRKVPVMENWTYPIWHQWGVLLIAIGCLVGEWGLRRWRGMP